MKFLLPKTIIASFVIAASAANADAVNIGDISIEDMTFKEVGTAVYTDCFFKTFFEQQYGQSFKDAFGIDAYTTEVVLEESEQLGGYYRLVHPYKELCEEIIAASDTWGYVFYYMEDSDYLRINAVDKTKAYVDSYLMENTGIYPMDGLYEYETPLYPASGAWWQTSDNKTVNPDYYFKVDGNVFTVKPTPTEDFDFSNKTNTNTPLFTVAMWSDPVTYGTVERYFPASVGICDFRLELKVTDSAVGEISAPDFTAIGGNGSISFSGNACDRVTVFNINGNVVYDGAPTTIPAVPGVYIVKSGSTSAKVLVK